MAGMLRPSANVTLPGCAVVMLSTGKMPLEPSRVNTVAILYGSLHTDLEGVELGEILYGEP